MIKHIVLFQHNDSVTDEVREDIKSRFVFCKEKTEGCTEIYVGANACKRLHLTDDYNFGVIMTFTDWDSLDEYLEIPEHKEILKINEEIVMKKLIFDVEY